MKNFIKGSANFIKKSFVVLTAVAFIAGGFFVAQTAFAAHTTTTTVDRILVKGGSTGTYTFTVHNDGADSIYKITINVATGFTINTSTIVCPTGWSNDGSSSASVAVCLTDNFGPDVLPSGSNAIISFQATAPLSNAALAWNVVTRDISGGFTYSIDNNAVTTVDSTVPTISTITTKDTDFDGRVDTATVVFSEAVDDSTFAPNDFSVGGSAGTSISTGTADDNTFDVVVAGGVAGTEVKDVTYTRSAGAGADMVGNLLANVVTGDKVEIDEAKPKLMSALTISPTTLSATFSEDLHGGTVNDLGGEFSVAGTVVSAANETAPGVITLTYTPALGPGATPNVTYTQVDTLNDLASPANTAVTPVTVTAVDGIKPGIASSRTVTTTTIEVTFTEAMSTIDKIDFGVTGHTISDAVLQGDTTKAILTVDAMGTGDVPNVSTVASPSAGTKDLANNIINGSLTSTPVDGVAPTITSTAPATNAYIKAEKVSYTLSEAAVPTSGVITFT
ncbi:MAG: hypothetical protein WC857_02385, partial [Candidatus Paceibacterota bacterium]